MTKTFKSGDYVSVLSLKRTGKIISSSGNNSFKVAIGDLQMNCKAKDLQPAARPEADEYGKKIRSALRRQGIKASKSLDLHGFTAASAKEAILRFISQAVMAGHQEICIIHGHGSGKIREVVQSTLSDLEVVASFRHPINNTAETKVYLA